jgi:tetratricopeptide (TPR) repeat protein
LIEQAHQIYKVGDKARALAKFREVLVLNPKNVNARADVQTLLNLTAIDQYQTGDQDGAIQTLNEVLSLNPDNADAKKNLAIILQSTRSGTE